MGEPECGFLFPAFSDRSGDFGAIDLFEKNPEKPHRELYKFLQL